MWTISLVMFALGSAGLWLGGAIGWSEWSFKSFYLFGAILNVPFLALGTVYLLGGRRRGDVATAVVCAARRLRRRHRGGRAARPTPSAAPTPAPGLRRVRLGPRIAAGVGSGVAATVIIVGAVWSAVRLLPGRRRSRPPAAPAIPAGRLAAANLVIAAGTLILSAGGILNSAVDAMNAFAVSLVVGIAVIFAGFLLASSPAAPGPASGPRLRWRRSVPVALPERPAQELAGRRCAVARRRTSPSTGTCSGPGGRRQNAMMSSSSTDVPGSSTT